MKKWLLLFYCLIAFTCAHAKLKPLPVDQAFKLSGEAADLQNIILHWHIASGYYLYRDRFKFLIKAPAQEAQLGQIIYPKGVIKFVPELGKFEVYKKDLDLTVPVLFSGKPQEITLWITFQGCSSAGFCYPPTTRQIQLNMAGNYNQLVSATPIDMTDNKHVSTAQQEKITRSLNHHLWLSLLTFIGLGLLLSFTPCVLPMVPILSSIIVGQQNLNTRKAFFLSLAYVLSMAVTYAIAGVVVGLLGSNIQILLQKDWILILFSLVFVLLALSLFGFYRLTLPSWLEEKISNLSRRQKSGSYLGVIIMGCLATLIVSPCVTPALVGVLTYITQTGNALIGGISLFALGIGMGIPLLIIGTLGGKILPKAGTWMKVVEATLGVLLLGVALSLLGRVLPGQISMVLWSLLFIITSVYMGSASSTPAHKWGKFSKGLGIVLLVYGIILAVGASRGSTNLLNPLGSESNQTQITLQAFKTVKTLTEVQQNLELAKQQHKPVILDFYADWCIACKEMEHTTFADPSVRSALNHFVVLRADVTANDANAQQLLKYYNVVAPPTLLFFDVTGKELTHKTIVGEVNADNFLKYLHSS